MNSVHDMGGMHGMGPIKYEVNESWYKEDWEARVWGLNRAVGQRGWANGRWSDINFRYELESIPAVDYLRMSYYERIFEVLVDKLLRNDLLSAAEVETGIPDPGRPVPAALPATPRVSTSERQNIQLDRSFKIEQVVRVRNLHPEGHIRLPRYTRGHQGTVMRDNGVFGSQDTDANGRSLGGRAQPVYTVRFAARELWGAGASPRDHVFVEMWEDYLEANDVCN